jgi:hypothetical protein
MVMALTFTDSFGAPTGPRSRMREYIYRSLNQGKGDRGHILTSNRVKSFDLSYAGHDLRLVPLKEHPLNVRLPYVRTAAGSAMVAYRVRLFCLRQIL